MAKERTFGTVAREAREALGMTQGVLAEAIEVSVSFLSDVERDHRALGRGHWPALSRELHLGLMMLAEAEVRTRPVRVDGRDLSAEDRARLARMLAALAAKKK